MISSRKVRYAIRSGDDRKVHELPMSKKHRDKAGYIHVDLDVDKGRDEPKPACPLFRILPAAGSLVLTSQPRNYDAFL
jgi:hypothetical protein